MADDHIERLAAQAAGKDQAARQREQQQQDAATALDAAWRQVGERLFELAHEYHDDLLAAPVPSPRGRNETRRTGLFKRQEVWVEEEPLQVYPIAAVAYWSPEVQTGRGEYGGFWQHKGGAIAAVGGLDRGAVVHNILADHLSVGRTDVVPEHDWGKTLRQAIQDGLKLERSYVGDGTRDRYGRTPERVIAEFEKRFAEQLAAARQRAGR